MTLNEEKLIEIAKEVISLNRHLKAKLSGSLSLCVLGINKQHEAKDIDIICDYLCEMDEGYPLVPNGFKRKTIYGSASQVDAIQFENEAGVKIDFMVSEEPSVLVDGIQVCLLQYTILAKLKYCINDKNSESAQKHLGDVIFLFDNNYFTIRKS